MTNAIWQETIVNERGDILPGATVSVYDSTGTTLQDVFDSAGDPLVNPLVADHTGEVVFYIPTGFYYLVVAYGPSSKNYPDVAIGTSVDADEAITLLTQGI